MIKICSLAETRSTASASERHELHDALLLGLGDVPQFEKRRGILHRLPLHDLAILFPAARTIGDANDVPRVVGGQCRRPLVSHAELLIDLVERGLGHRHLAVGEKIVRVTVLFDADHLAAQHVVLFHQ